MNTPKGVYADSVSGLEMDLLSGNCGQNIEVRNGNTAKWTDKTPHIFHSKTNIRPGNYKFDYRGTGHASVGVGTLTEAGHVDWIFKANIHCKKEHGNGSIVLSENGRLSFELQGKEENSMVVSGPQSLYLLFDIRFGNISFCAKDTKLMSLSQDAKAVTAEGHTYISLCHKNSKAFCVVQNPLTADKNIELLFDVASHSQASIPRYWHIKLSLSNTSPESNGNCTSSCNLKRYKNSKGTICVAMKANGEVLCSFKDQTLKANTENLHLSQPIYLWLELYRCQVKINSYNESEKVPMSYITVNSNQPHTVAVDDNRVGIAENRRPHKENYNDEPVAMKTPRLQSQIQDFCQRMDDEDDTELKLLLEVNGPQTLTVALDDPMMQDNHVGIAEYRRSHEENYNDEPVAMKTPRLQSQTQDFCQRMDDEDNTKPKVLEDDGAQELKLLTQMLSIANQMKNTDSRSHYDSMFKNIRTAFLEKLENLENNHSISEVVLVNMRHSIETL